MQRAATKGFRSLQNRATAASTDCRFPRSSATRYAAAAAEPAVATNHNNEPHSPHLWPSATSIASSFRDNPEFNTTPPLPTAPPAPTFASAPAVVADTHTPLSSSTAITQEDAHVYTIYPTDTTTTFPSLDFNDPQQALHHKTTFGLFRSLAVLRACRIKWLVGNADALLAGSKKVFGAGLVNFGIKHTFYKQFVGGENAEALRPLLARLSSHGIGAVLDYAAEDDVQEEGGPCSRQPPVDTVVARTYIYEDEAACDRRLQVFLRSIEAAQHATPPGRQGYAAIKLTALGPPALLERVSVALLAVQSLFSAFDEDGDGTVSADEFERVHRRLFSEGDGVGGSDVFDVFDYDWLDTDHDGRVDYVAFTKRVTLPDAARIAARCRQQGPFSRAALSSEELRFVDAMMTRVDTLAEEASRRGVRLLIDAEHSYFQPAIDAAVAELQRRYNRKVPMVYGTYQCYRTDVHDRMAVDIERARREGYKFGCKLVRGAYMELERQRATALNIPSPIWPTIQETHAAYDTAASSLMPLVRDESAEVMIATHNQHSIESVVHHMQNAGLSPHSGVSFGQLLGMADHLTYLLGSVGFRAFKYCPYGEIELVMPYLIRRAQENSDVLGGTAAEEKLMRREVKRRLFGGGGGSGGVVKS